MNTKPVPIVIVLLACAVSCIISVLQGVEFSTFFMRLLVTVIVFFIVGIATKIFLDFVFNKKIPEEESEGAEEEKSENPDEEPGNEEDDEIIPGTEREQDDYEFNDTDEEE